MTFTMWSFGHFLFILSPFVFFLLLHIFTKDLRDKQKLKVGLWISVIAIIILILRNVEIWVQDGFKFSAELIPLQICHFANFVLLFAFLKNNQKMFALSVSLNLPAALLSIIYANSLTNYATILNFRGFAYIAGHMIIVGLAIWAVFANLVHINKKTLFKTLLLMLGLYVIAHLVNNVLTLFDLTPNYFYTMAPESGTPLELFYTLGKTYELGFFTINPIYFVLTALVGLVVVVIFYEIYVLIMKALHQDLEEKSETITIIKQG